MCCSIHRAQTQIGRKDLPDDLGLEPHVRFCAPGLDVTPHRLNLERFERFIELREHFLGETRTDLADRLKVLRVRVVACQEECAVYCCPLALAMICANDDEIERVADTCQVVLLELHTASAEEAMRRS